MLKPQTFIVSKVNKSAIFIFSETDVREAAAKMVFDMVTDTGMYKNPDDRGAIVGMLDELKQSISFQGLVKTLRDGGPFGIVFYDHFELLRSGWLAGNKHSKHVVGEYPEIETYNLTYYMRDETTGDLIVIDPVF